MLALESQSWTVWRVRGGAREEDELCQGWFTGGDVLKGSPMVYATALWQHFLDTV